MPREREQWAEPHLIPSCRCPLVRDARASFGRVPPTAGARWVSDWSESSKRYACRLIVFAGRGATRIEVEHVLTIRPRTGNDRDRLTRRDLRIQRIVGVGRVVAAPPRVPIEP